MKANNVKLTEEIYYKFKTGESVYKKLNLEKFISEFRNQSNELIDNTLKYDIQHLVDNNNFDLQDNCKCQTFL